MLSRDDDVDVVAAAQTMIHDRQQTVAVRRQIDADDFGLLIGDVIEKAGILVCEAIVILAPHV